MNVEFNEPTYESVRATNSVQPSPLAKFFIDRRLASDNRGAQRIILALFIIVLVAEGILLVVGFDDTPIDNGRMPLEQPAP